MNHWRGSWHRFFGNSEKGPEQRWMKVCFTPCKGIQDSLVFWIPRRGFQIPDTGFQPLSVKVEFWISIVSGIPDSLSCISDSKAPENSRFRKHNFLGFRIQDSHPTGGESCTRRGFLYHSACRGRVSESKQASMQASKQLYYTQKKYIIHAHYLHFSKSFSRQAVWGRCILTIRHLIQKTFCHRVTYTLTYIRCFTGN